MRLVFTNMGLVFRQWSYLFLAAVAAVVFYVANVLLSQAANFATVYASLGFKGIFSYAVTAVSGYGQTVEPAPHAGLIVTSALIGILLSLIIFKTRLMSTPKTGGRALSSFGIAFGILAPGCAACGVGLFSTQVWVRLH